MRLDVYLTENGFAESRTKAQAMIQGGNVRVDGRPCLKASAEVDAPEIELCGETLRYVGRGGLKLERALDVFGILPEGKTAVDVGASTGGFTQCLLMRGAKRVFAVDAGHDQLHPLLRRDSRVIPMEGVNARSLTAELLGSSCEIAVMDVSFISQTLLYPAVASVLTANGIFISLIKPQFEAGKKNIGKNGVVRDPRLYREAMEHIVSEAQRCGLFCHGITASPIMGGDGNREFLAWFDRNAPVTVTQEAILKLAFQTRSGITDPQVIE